MAHHLEMAMIHAILTLHGQGWSHRRIARELGLNRETVGRHVALAGSKPASAAGNPPPGAAGLPEGVEGPKPATETANPPPGAAGASAENPPAGTETCGAVDEVSGAPTGPTSDCEPYRVIIEEKLNDGLSGRRIYQDLAGDGKSPSYDSIKRFLRHLRKSTVLPFRRMEKAPGQESQVDFGTGAPIVGAGRRKRRTHVIRVVLSCSRKAYSEAVYRQTTDDFLGCLENAFWALGGVTATVIIDNLRAAVQHPDWFDPEVNPRVDAFCSTTASRSCPPNPTCRGTRGKWNGALATSRTTGSRAGNSPV